MEKVISPLYQTVLAIKLWLPVGAETQSWLTQLCVQREKETLQSWGTPGKRKSEVVLASVLAPQE